MSTAPLEHVDPAVGQGCTPHRRVRHELRDAVAVMAFSATTSCALAVLLTLVVRVGG